MAVLSFQISSHRSNFIPTSKSTLQIQCILSADTRRQRQCHLGVPEHDEHDLLHARSDAQDQVLRLDRSVLFERQFRECTHQRRKQADHQRLYAVHFGHCDQLLTESGTVDILQHKLRTSYVTPGFNARFQEKPVVWQDYSFSVR